MYYLFIFLYVFIYLLIFVMSVLHTTLLHGDNSLGSLDKANHNCKRKWHLSAVKQLSLAVKQYQNFYFSLN